LWTNALTALQIAMHHPAEPSARDSFRSLEQILARAAESAIRFRKTDRA